MMTDEVVITGYSNINKKSFTGNSVQIKKDELLKVSKTNVFSALQAFDPSFRIQENASGDQTRMLFRNFISVVVQV